MISAIMNIIIFWYTYVYTWGQNCWIISGCMFNFNKFNSFPKWLHKLILLPANHENLSCYTFTPIVDIFSLSNISYSGACVVAHCDLILFPWWLFHFHMPISTLKKIVDSQAVSRIIQRDSMYLSHSLPSKDDLLYNYSVVSKPGNDWHNTINWTTDITSFCMHSFFWMSL